MTSIDKTKEVQSTKKNKVLIELIGVENEYLAIYPNGDWGSSSFAGIKEDLESILINDVELSEEECKKIKINNCPNITYSFDHETDEVVGITCSCGSGGYYCEIEIDGEFDIEKLELNMYYPQFKVNDEVVFTESCIKLCGSISYDGVKYFLEYGSSNSNGTDLVWGIDPNDDEWDDEWEEEDDDDDDEN